MNRFSKYLLFLVAAAVSAACLNQPAPVNNANASPTPDIPMSTSPPTPLPTATAEVRNILFIVDSSGSMKAKAGAKTKMEAAKEVIANLIGDLPQNVHAGLMAYGHRQKNDCKDVEL